MSVNLAREHLMDLAITLIAPDDLLPDKRNARTHSKAQVNQISNSIQQYGFVNPILVDEQLRVIAGHGRLLAAKLLGLRQVPIIILRGLSEVQKQALRIADNAIALKGGWDTEMLRLEIGEILIEAPELELGFDTGEIDVLLATKVDPDEEAIPAVPERPTSRLGDIWTVGPHRFWVGDCADERGMSTMMAGDVADAAVHDAPYNQPAKNIGNKGKTKHADLEGAAGQLSFDEFVEFMTDRFRVSANLTRDGGVHFLFMDHQHAEEVLAAGRAVYGRRLNIAIWDKSNAGMGALYRSKHEMVFVYSVGTAQHLNNVQLGKHGRNRTNVWNAQSVNTFGGSRRQDLALHPTVKPVQLIADAVMDVTRRGDIVMDSFLGSGTTLIACERVGRRCRGAEISPQYADVIIDRFTTLTGVEAILEETGEMFSQVRVRRAAEGGEGRA